jgi:predicted amidohydrolase
LKAGFIQFAPALGDLQTTIQAIDRLSASIDQVDLLVLPELCNSGYNFESDRQAWDTSEELGDSVFVRYLVALSRRLGCHIVSGVNERDGDHLYNSAILAGPRGVTGHYRKLHLFLNEKTFFEPGNLGLPVFDIGPCQVGMLVCFDWIFPEVWRILALKGADVICHPSNLVLPGLAQRAVPIHALVNRVFTITANRTGTEGQLTFTGLSTIADPGGQVLHQGPPTGEHVAVVDIDISVARNKQITSRNHLFDDRRLDAYAGLLEHRAGRDADRD